mgnify:CR=1 FL=1
MLKVSEILRVKGHTLYTATPETPIKQALETMAEQDIGSLVIMEHGELVGMVTFREIIRHLHGNHGATGDFTIRSIMDDSPVSVTPNTSAEEVQRLMLDKHPGRSHRASHGPHACHGWPCSAGRHFVLRHGTSHCGRTAFRKQHAEGLYSRLANRTRRRKQQHQAT